jgi:ribokinase
MGRVIVVGSLNVDLVTMVERHPQPGETVLGENAGRYAGGKGANQAMAARRAGAEVTMVGAVGADDAGDAYLRRLADHGIDCRIASLEGVATGTAVITVDAAGENSIIVIPGANGELDVRQVGAGPGDVVLLQLEVPL